MAALGKQDNLLELRLPTQQERGIDPTSFVHLVTLFSTNQFSHRTESVPL